MQSDPWVFWTFIIASADDISSEEELLERWNTNSLEQVNHSVFDVHGPKDFMKQISFGLAFESGWCNDNVVFIFLDS